MRELTIVFPHFCNLGMLAEQQRIWADYPSELRARLHVVVVDDCSPKGQRPGPKAITIEGLASIRLFRLLKKKRWNWLACRNLGAKVATTEWVLLTDIDHAIPALTLERILDGELDPRNVYRFSRVDAPCVWPYNLLGCKPYKPHNDTWLLTRDLFFDERVGGYDERLSGCYGTSGEFRDRLVAVARAQVMLSEPIIRYPREVIADASTPPSAVYTRKNDPVNDADLAERKRKRALIPNWKPLHGLIPHEEIPC
jgi:hypothetical protein